MNLKKQNEYLIKEDYAIVFVKRKDIILEVLVDIEDVMKIINVGSWHAILDKTLQTPSYYIAHRYNNKKQGKGVYKLHRFITNCPRNKVIDHINHNTLDNRKANLKVCSIFENQQNLRNKKTKQTGVYQIKNEKWVGNITKNKIRLYKEFRTKEQAIKWRKQKERELYGEVI